MIDEDAFRGSGNAVAPPADENIAEDWDVLRGLPRYLYIVYPGSSCDTMELWRLRCVGQQRMKRAWRSEDQWQYKHDRPLWQGQKASQKCRKIGRTYITPKRCACLTLAEAFSFFQKKWDEHVRNMRLEVKRLDEVIETYQRDRTLYLASIREMEKGPAGVQIVAEIEDSKGSVPDAPYATDDCPQDQDDLPLRG